MALITYDEDAPRPQTKQQKITGILQEFYRGDIDIEEATKKLDELMPIIYSNYPTE